MALSLLNSAEDWDLYRESFLSLHNVTSKTTWGKSPESYPCLVGATIVANNIVCMFVYPEDVQLLNGSPKEEYRKKVKAPVSDSSLFSDKAIVALIKELKEVGILKRDRFESSLMSAEESLLNFSNDVESAVNSQLGSGS